MTINISCVTFCKKQDFVYKLNLHGKLESQKLVKLKVLMQNIKEYICIRNGKC